MISFLYNKEVDVLLSLKFPLSTEQQPKKKEFYIFKYRRHPLNKTKSASPQNLISQLLT